MADERGTPLNQLKDKLLQITSEGIIETIDGNKADLSEELKDKVSLSGEETISNKAIENSSIGLNDPQIGHFRQIHQLDSSQNYLSRMITLTESGGSSSTLTLPDPFASPYTAVSGILYCQAFQPTSHVAFAVRTWRVSGYADGLSFQEIGSQDNASSGGSTLSLNTPQNPNTGVITVSTSWAFTPRSAISFHGLLSRGE